MNAVAMQLWVDGSVGDGCDGFALKCLEDVLDPRVVDRAPRE